MTFISRVNRMMFAKSYWRRPVTHSIPAQFITYRPINETHSSLKAHGITEGIRNGDYLIFERPHRWVRYRVVHIRYYSHCTWVAELALAPANTSTTMQGTEE